MMDSADPQTLSTSLSGPDTGANIAAPVSPARRAMRILAWTALGIFFMILFTILKLPEDRVRNYIQGNIAAALSGQGIGFTANEGHLSILKGVSYTMKDITLTLPPPGDVVKVQEITISPAILPMFTGRLGGQLRLQNGNGSLTADFSMRKNDMALSYDAKSLDLGTLGVVAAAAGIKAGALLSGSGELSGDLNTPSTLTGRIGVDLSQIVIDAQSIQGFSIPRSTVSEGKADFQIDKGKALIKALRLGKPGNASEDIRANVTGDMTLARTLTQSTLNLRADFSLSQNIMKSVGPLDLILGMAKQPDGSYALQITGPAYNPMAVPAAPGAK